MIGTIVNGKYEIKKLIAESSQYEVYEATEAETGSTVVFKILDPEAAKNEAKIKLFSEEVAIFAKLSHPFVSHVLDFDVIDGRPFLVTELVEGKDVRAWIKEDEISFFEAVQVVKQVADVLQFAAEQNISPRHVKQSNIMRTKDGKIKILSFSLPRLKLVGVTESDANAGAQADLFFLGTMFFEILTDESPIRRRGGINEMWDNKLRQALRIRYQQLDPEEIDRVVEVIDRTFTREVKARFNNLQEFIKILVEMGRVAEKTMKSKKVVPQKNLGSASEVVDAIHGRMTGEAAIVSIALPGKAGSSSGMSSTIQGCGSKSGRGSAMAALAVEDPMQMEDEKPQFGRPILQLIKGGRDVARSAIWRSGDETVLYKNPLIIMGSGLLFMISLILFW